MSTFDPSLEEGYGDITAAARRDELIEVEFLNGDLVAIEAAGLGIVGEFTVGVADGGLAVMIESLAGGRELDWTVVRAATDMAFAQFLRGRDAEDARRIGRRLRALRQNNGMSQKVVASAVGMPASQLAKLEQGETDMRISTLQSLLRALGAQYADIAGPDAPEMSINELSRLVQKVGVPAEVVKRLAATVGPRQLLQAVSRAFSWEPENILRGALTEPMPVAAPVLKRRSSTSKDSSALLTLAESLALRSALAFAGVPGRVPCDPDRLRDLVPRHGPDIPLEALLEWCWNSGIVVAPMVGGGGFSAGAWLIGEQPVIILREAPDDKARWLFALAHELGHLGHGDVGRGGLVDIGSSLNHQDDEQEAAANEYALDLLIPDTVEVLAEIRRRLQGLDPDEKLKHKAMDVARELGYDAALVLLITAFGLRDLGRDDSRWGSANNEASKAGSAREAVTAAYQRHVDLDRLDRLDAGLLRALVVGQ
jgi:transcriptional regulator with XRE-family HTH domain/Zn-dependent peptidase ImmA (M78 family)